MPETKATNAQIASLNELASPPRSLFKDAWSHLTRNKVAVVAMVIISIFFIVAVKLLSFTLLGDGLRDAFDPACR